MTAVANSAVATSSWCAGATIAQPSTVSMFPGTLLHPTNPVVFLDIAVPAVDPTTNRKVLPQPEGITGFERPVNGSVRVVVELFAHKAPGIAQNFYVLCTGTQQRVVNHREVPVGYRGCSVFAANPGGSVDLGDVMCNDGKGVFSIFNRGNHFLAHPPFAKEALLDDALGLPAQPGLVVMLPVATSVGELALGDGGAGCPVGSIFRILLDPPQDMRAFARDAVVVGRVIGCTKTDVELSIGHLQRVSKVVFQVLREASGGAADVVLPGVVQCGEL